MTPGLSQPNPPATSLWQHRLFIACRDTLFTFAAIHFVLMVIHVLLTGRWQELNLFYILSLQNFIHPFPDNLLSFILGGIITVALWYIYYRHSRTQ